MDESKDPDVVQLRRSTQLLTLGLALAGAVMVVCGVVGIVIGLGADDTRLVVGCLGTLISGAILLALRRCLLLLVKLFGRLVIAAERQTELLEGSKTSEG